MRRMFRILTYGRRSDDASFSPTSAVRFCALVLVLVGVGVVGVGGAARVAGANFGGDGLVEGG